MSKKILFIAHDANVFGANQSLVNMVSSLIDKGVFILVIFPNFGPICKIFHEKGWNYKVVNFRNELMPENINCVEFCKNFLRLYFKKINNIIALKELSEIVKQYKINLIHTNSSVVSIGYELSKKMQIRHVWHLREYIHPNYKLFIFGGLERHKSKIQNSDKIVAITFNVAKFFNVENKSLILSDAVRSQPKFEKPILKEKYFLFCGSLIKNKGIEEAIDAFYEIYKIFPDYRLIIIGVGECTYEDFLKKKVGKLGMTRSVNFLGFRDNVDELMAKATALLMCSRNEALGRVTIEAMLNFCVVFGYNDSGTADIIINNQTGILYETTDELVYYMNKIINNEGCFDEIREQAYKFSTENYLEKGFGNRLIDFYDSILS